MCVGPFMSVVHGSSVSQVSRVLRRGMYVCLVMHRVRVVVWTLLFRCGPGGCAVVCKRCVEYGGAGIYHVELVLF